MKTQFPVAILICFLLQITSGFAQTKSRFPALNDRISNAKLNEIGKRMELDKSKIEKIRPLFLNYEKEKSVIFNERNSTRGEWSTDGLTDEEAEKMYLSLLDKTRKITDLREKYYHEFRKTLSPKEVFKFHKVEMEVNRKMIQTLRKRVKDKFQ